MREKDVLLKQEVQQVNTTQVKTFPRPSYYKIVADHTPEKWENPTFFLSEIFIWLTLLAVKLQSGEALLGGRGLKNLRKTVAMNIVNFFPQLQLVGS